MTVATDFRPIGQSFEELYGFLNRARSEEPIFFSDEHQAWVVTRYHDIAKILNDSDHFTVADVLQAIQHGSYDPAASAVLAQGVDWNRTKHIQADDSPDHSRFRSAIQNVLTPRRIRSLEKGIRETAIRLIEKVRADGRCAFVRSFAYPYPLLTIFQLIGFDEGEEDLDQLQRWSDNMFRLFFQPLQPEEQVRCAEDSVRFQGYIRAKIHARQAEPTGDLMSEMLASIAAGTTQLSEDELVLMFTMSFIGAGHETTKSAITSSVYHLLRQPERWQGLVDQPETISEVIEECLRYDTPVLAWYRTVAQDQTVADIAMKAGERVVLMLGSANHDESRFEDAADFCPARGRFTRHMTFSVGKHFCIGAPLARLEMRIAFEEMAKRLPNLRLTAGQPIAYDPSFAGRTISELLLEWDVA